MVFGRKKGWIGIDLGARSLKLAQVERAGTGLRIAASAVMPRTRTPRSERDAASDGCDWTSREILAALSMPAGFSGRTTACALPMCIADLNVLSLPNGGIAERRAMIANELSSTFAADGREREFGFWDAASAATEKPSTCGSVNVLSVPRRLVSSVVGAISGAGLTCEVMDGLPLALARAVKLADGPGVEAPVGALDWGFASATFCAVSGGKPLFTRHLRSCGVGLLVDAVSRALDFSEEDAVQLLAEHGLPDPECRSSKSREIQEVIAEVAGNRLNEMAEELNKTVSYLKTQYSEIVPKRLHLFGDGATVKNVTTSLSRKIGVPIELWRLGHQHNETPDDPYNHPATLGTAVALSALAFAS